MKTIFSVAEIVLLCVTSVGAVAPGDTPKTVIPKPRPAVAADAATAVTESPPDLVGVYICDGTDSGNKAYRGVVVVRKAGDHYHITWSIGSGVFQGVGIRTGDTLSVGWAQPGPQGQMMRGVNVYAVGAAREGGGVKSLAGKWTSFPGPATSGRETLTFAAGLDEREPDDDNDDE